MSYQLIPNIIFIFSVLGIILLILRRLPEAGKAITPEEAQQEVHLLLKAKGLPAVAISKTKTILKLWIKKIWDFALEAKDLRPSNAVGYKFKKIFQAKNWSRPAVKSVQIAAEQPITNHSPEDHFFELIKEQPKNLSHYDSLGKHYLENNNFEDAKDIYLYLHKHEPANSDFLARLAYCCYMLKNYEQAAEYYKGSLALDSNQPNRYYNLGICLEHLDNFSEAITALTSALSLEPENYRFLMSLSKAYLKIGDGEKAQLFLNQAQKINEKQQTVS